MRIGFDAKRAIHNFTGLGNYSRFVISNLMKYCPENTYKLFIPKIPNNNEVNSVLQTKNNFFVKEGCKPFWRTFQVVRDIKKENIEVYHGLSNELPFGIKSSRAKSIVTIHDLIFLQYPNFYPVIDRIIYNIKAKYACRVADRIIAVSECTKRDVIKHYGIDPSKIDVVYQGCFSIFKEPVDELKKEDVINTYNLPSEFLLSVGSIEERKNILLIVKALKGVPNIHFYAIGKQRQYADEVMRYALENGLSDRVHLISNVPLVDLPAIMQLSTVFIYPSLYEGFGIPIIEALSSGVPVVGATGSCLEEAGGPNSIYVNPQDEKELAFQINRLLSDASLRENMVKQGKEYVKRFDDISCTEALKAVYKKLV